ncbi:MAG: DUF427 domain-containing protein [Actinophytocola sp.]|uniref:DUF427 domain-containing protein n=1 Tax=Actinophytocola sp. TaxID=1872138 RepID=UPI003D6AFB5D
MADTRGKVKVETSRKRIRAYVGGHLVADSFNPVLVWEIPYYPTIYLPLADVRGKLEATGSSEHSPSRGDATQYDVVVDGTVVKTAASRYLESPIPELRDLVKLHFAAMDEWLEEDEPIYVHPRDPYKRVDILGSSRHVEVRVDGVTVADSHQPRILFETSLPPRYYLPLSDVRMDLLRPSDLQTHCPYKGTASYWNLDTGEDVHENVVWIYRAPLPESQKVTGLACFYNEKVDIVLDGEVQERPRTPFS